jgi:hypothetical protein
VRFFLGFNIFVPSGDSFDEAFKLLGRLVVPGRIEEAVDPVGIPGIPCNCW